MLSVGLALSTASSAAASNSGPIDVSIENESAAIRNAPAYDTEDAKRYIDDMPEIRELIDGIEDGDGLTAFGKKLPSGEVMQKLLKEIRSLTADDHQLSMVMVDLRTKSGVAYKSSLRMCTQSTVKAIYVGALLESNPEALQENGKYMRDAIEFSLNDPYRCLRDIYGDAPMRRWCQETGVDEGFAASYYPRTYTARDMFKLWTKLYCFLNTDNPAGSFAAYYADSSCSATKKQLGGRFPVQTKAGWEGGLDENLNYDPDAKIPAFYTDKDPENDECSINDTGVVYSDHGPYLFVIYTDHPFGVYRDYTTVNPLYNLTELLYEVQCSIAEHEAAS